jgi:NADH-quinone oxidoreductase subunit N
MNSFGSDILHILPLILVTVTSLIVLVIEFSMTRSEGTSFTVSLLGIAGALFFVVDGYGSEASLFTGMVQTSAIGNFMNGLFLISAGIAIALSRSYLEREELPFGEFYWLILSATIGMMIIGLAGDLLIVFLGVELMSISLYVLAGFLRRRIKSNESALKYFLLGAFATGFLLYGIALIYGASGTTTISTIAEKFPDLSSSYLFLSGIGLLIVGFSFKIAAVPFHMWVPDVYEGSPTTATAFMATGSKAAAFAAFLVVFGRVVEPDERLTLVFLVLSVASMVLGNIVAISQSNIKRMLAYSSIAHAGYMLVGLAAGTGIGRESVVFYLAAYTLMNIGAFGIVAVFEKKEEMNLTFDDYAGLSRKYPVLSACMAIFMFSLAGIPPFGGFFAKYYVFTAAVQSDHTWLAIIGVLMSLISVYYYLRLIVMMYFKEGEGIGEDRISHLDTITIALAAVGVIALGIVPATILSLIGHS